MGLNIQLERSKALLEKFNSFKSRMTSDCAILEQELIKYVTQMDFELREYSQGKIGLAVENIDISTFRKYMRSVLNASVSMVDAFEM